MQRPLTVLSSRGLAALVLVGGVVLALPYIRLETDRDNATTFDSQINVNELLQSEIQVAQPASAAVSASLTSTELPSPVRPADLPNWVASNPPPMQLLLRETTVTTPKAEVGPLAQPPLQPLRPWIAEPLQVNNNELTRPKAHPNSMVQKADSSSPWDLKAPASPALNAPAFTNHNSEWPDQRMQLQDINHLAHEPIRPLETLQNSQLAGSAAPALSAAPIQPASLKLVGEQPAQPIQKTDKPKHFIFQPGMKR